MMSEMDFMYTNQVWALIDVSEGFKKKTDMDGNIQTYKARLVAKGYRQRHGIDYEETFSPVAMIKSIRIMLAIAAYFDYEIWQMDVKTAFLNGNLLEDVYMQQPDGFIVPKHANKVCKLIQSIYGLKQALRSWNKRFDVIIMVYDLIQNEYDACVYKEVTGSTLTMKVLNNDDISFLGNDIPI